jgi:hypothetical protein
MLEKRCIWWRCRCFCRWQQQPMHVHLTETMLNKEQSPINGERICRLKATRMNEKLICLLKCRWGIGNNNNKLTTLKGWHNHPITSLGVLCKQRTHYRPARPCLPSSHCYNVDLEFYRSNNAPGYHSSLWHQRYTCHTFCCPADVMACDVKNTSGVLTYSKNCTFLML